MTRRRPADRIRADIEIIKGRIARKRLHRERTADDDVRLRMLVRELLGAEVRERRQKELAA